MNKAHYIIPVFVPHEGCPHTCVFCNQESYNCSSFKIDGDYVRKTIEEYLSTMDRCNSIIEVSFFGGTFTAISLLKQKEILTVAKEYKDANRINYIRLSTRPDYINDEILSNLRNYNVDIIELGVQSLDEEVLVKAGRGHSSEDVEKATKLIKSYGFTLGHQIMLGLPGDTREKDIETTKKLIKLKPDFCRIYPSLVIKDTPMEKMLKLGLYKPYTLEEAVSITKEVYGLLTTKNITVIRIGLQPTEEINYGGDIIEGPFHPAFRELVEGSIYCDMIRTYLEVHSELAEININSKEISKLYTNKKQYF
jgi:histone acetyltransferase (RNA polymerase elongator complex component)